MQRQLGNAVPSLIAEILAREIWAQLLGRPVRGRLKLLPPRRDGVPAPEKIGRLPVWGRMIRKRTSVYSVSPER